MKDLYEFAGMNYGSEQQRQRLLDKQSEFNPFKYRTNVPWRVIEMFDLEFSEVHSTKKSNSTTFMSNLSF